MLNKMLDSLRGFKASWRWYLSTSFVPNMNSRNLRNWGMRKLGVKMSKNVQLFKGFSVRTPGNLTIEDGVSIGPGVLLDARRGLTIRTNAVIAYEAIIWTLNHDYNDENFCLKGSPVEIGEYAWVCSRAIILPGITIGKGAIVASGAVVTKDVKPFDVVAGVPAMVVGHREEKEYKYGYEANMDYSFF